MQKALLYIKIYRFFLLLAVVATFLSSCNSTKFVPKGKYLLNKVEIKLDDEDIQKEQLQAHIRQKSNLRILGFAKFHLGLYNLSSKKREDDWLKRIGEAPVIYEDYQTRRSIDQLKVYLNNKGYYNAVIEDTVIRHRKKAKVNQVYRIKAGRPFTIRKLEVDIKNDDVALLLRKDSVAQLIKEGDILDYDVLNAERQRITRRLKNEGYYRFSEDYIRFEASDSAIYDNQVNLVMIIDEKNQQDIFKRYRIGNYLIHSDYIAPHLQKEGNVQLDSIQDGDYTFVHHKKPNYKLQLFKNLNRIPDSTYYNLKNVEKTYRALNRLRQFKVININFSEVDSVPGSGEGVLDCQLQLSPLPKQGISIDLEGTNSSGNLGVAGNLNMQHRNAFRGAEVLDFQIRGAMERQQAVIENSDLEFNTLEFGAEGGITIPKFLSPLKNIRMFGYQIPRTKFSIGYNYQRRPDYTRTITNATLGYNWKPSQFVTQQLNLLDINYVNLSEFNEDFIEKIRDYYIKSSFTDHLIFALNYSWTFNNQNPNRRSSYKFMKLNFESAGNVLSAYSNLLGRGKTYETDAETNQVVSYYEAFNTRFAQYLKADFEYRYGYMIDKYNSLVSRGFIGLGLPYGNFDVLPFEKKYFTGGANGIRAWQVRSLGPGNFTAPEGDYPNQSSDIKLEASLEYRFRLMMMMEGAFFVDAGNIWAISSKDNRKGAVFKFDNFYKQIAIGTGFGLRFDFTYFLFRLDLGMKLRDPSLEEGKRWIPGNYRIDAEKFNLSFAIGYPF